MESLLHILQLKQVSSLYATQTRGKTYAQFLMTAMATEPHKMKGQGAMCTTHPLCPMLFSSTSALQCSGLDVNVCLGLESELLRMWISKSGSIMVHMVIME